MTDSIEKAMSKYWYVLGFIVTVAIQYGMFQTQFTQQGESIRDLKQYTSSTYGQVKKLESRADITDTKLEYQSLQNAQVLSSVKELTQSTNDLRVVVEGFKAQVASQGIKHEK